MFRSLIFASLALAAVGCAAQPDDGADATAETARAADKADDALGITNVAFEMVAPASYRAGDVTNLYLFGASSKPGVAPSSESVRGRCYHAGCSSWIPELASYDLVTSSGRRYLRFWMGDQSGKQVLVDNYEIRKTPTGIKLRKTYTTRWLTLAARTDQQLCEETGGTWGDAPSSTVVPMHGYTPCDCGAPSTVVFVPGTGGCFEPATVSEDACDSTQGSWTDDDSTDLGTFCACSAGQYLSSSGCTKI
jgi:hypothetical protein